MWTIYKITNEDGKIYIGCTRHINKRIMEHKSRKMPFVLKPYTMEIIAQSDFYEDAFSLEKELIVKFDSTNPLKGYNRRFGMFDFPQYVYENRTDTVNQRGGMSGENNPNYGKTHSPETREKIRQSTLARHPSTFDKNRTKTLEQLNKLHKGRDDYYEKYGHPMKGKKHSEEFRKKLSESAKGNQKWLGKNHSEQSKEKMRQKRIARAKLDCDIQNCPHPHKAKGYCHMHYTRFRRNGTTSL